MTRRRITALIADDVPEMRTSLRALLEASGRFTIVGDTGSGRDAVRLTLESRPDVVLLDLRMPDLDGITCAMQIRMAAPEVTVVVHSAHDDDRFVAELQELRIDAFVPKGSPGADVVRTIVDAVAHHAAEGPRGER